MSRRKVMEIITKPVQHEAITRMPWMDKARRFSNGASYQEEVFKVVKTTGVSVYALCECGHEIPCNTAKAPKVGTRHYCYLCPLEEWER